jgi:PAS domain S-box-containing protein
VADREAQDWMERCLLHQSPAAHWLLDSASRFCYATGDTTPLFGKPAADLLGRLLADLFPSDQADLWLRRLARVQSGETFVARDRVGDSLFGLVYFAVRAPGSGALYCAGCAQDITPLGTAEEELRDTTLRMLQAQASERGRLARFLHDEVGQCLSAVGLQLDLLRMDFEAALPEIGARTSELQAMLEKVMAGVRDFSYELNPDIVERAGLHAALDALVGRTRKRFPGNLRLMADSSLRFPPAVGSALYKIAAEALENALQHAGCSQIELIIKSTPDGPALEVRDNGKGFDTVDLGGPYRGLGLLVMEHYAGQTGLRLSVRSERGKGTTVRAVLESAGG